ncbi:LysR substrate-binding domain-containing protein [Alicycliphilus denitrificans]|uniref:LysR substrate-binding domain-containing protein n=1 Tax=Alicycliphilus denitrificans TaxID=179636 RepID=UPI003A7FC1CC
MSDIPPIASLQAFEAVARRRSFALAATELHLTASAISHQIARLEAQLEVRLFERNAHGVNLSAAGEQYLARIGSALTSLKSATNDLRHGVRNSLYVHSSPGFAGLWLLPRLRSFSQSHPNISLNLAAAHTHSDFALGQSDIDIRYGKPQWEDLEVESLFEEAVLPLASPSFIRTWKIAKPEQLLDVPLIRNNMSVVQWSDWFERFTEVHAPDHFTFRFDRTQMTLDAAAQGLGVSLSSLVNAQGYIANGLLKPIFRMNKAIKVKAHFAVYPSHHAKRPEVSSFLKWLRAEVRNM